MKNREALKAISGREGLPLRGHEDDSKHDANVCEKSSKNVGLFQNVLNFQDYCGDNVLREHLNTSAKKCLIHICSHTKPVNR